MGRPRTGGLGENAFLLVTTPVPMQSGAHSLSWWRCRGVATFKGGVPMRMNSVRMLWGKGVRAGLYPLSDTEAYWFTTKNCSSVRSCLALASPVVILCFQSPSLKDGLRKGNRAWRTFAVLSKCTPLLWTSPGLACLLKTSPVRRRHEGLVVLSCCWCTRE